MKFGDIEVLPGENKRISLKIGKLYDSTDLSLPIQVIRGKSDGPVIFLSGAIHGDEINGVEIIREVMKQLSPAKINGTIIASPIINVFGFNSRSRYLPDRRDLNRSFPGNPNGSLAGQIADLFLNEIVRKCTHGIDFHTGAVNRSNFAQIRADISEPKTLEFAKSFGAPIIINSKLRDGSLREAARNLGVQVLLFEGGEALRFSNQAIQAGRIGCLNALFNIGVLKRRKARTKKLKDSIIAQASSWTRSPYGGILRLKVKEGDYVETNQKVGEIFDPFGDKISNVKTTYSGYIIGINKLPLVTAGEALLHIASVDDHDEDQNSLYDEEI